MTFRPIDAYTLTDDHSYGWQLRYTVDNFRACIDDRQPCASHAYGGLTAKALPTFATATDQWRHIPIPWMPERGADLLTVRVRLDLATAAGSVRLRIGDRVGSTVAVSTGSGQTVTATIDVSGLGAMASAPGQSPVVVCLEFLSERATSIGTVEVVGTINGHQLAINEDTATMPATPTAGFYEVDLSESEANPHVMIQKITTADHHSDFQFDFWTDRSIENDRALRPFSGEAPQTAGPSEDVYPLSQWTIHGWEVEIEGDGDGYEETVRRQVGGGQVALARTINALTRAGFGAVASTMRWLAAGPVVGDSYGIGVRIGDSADQPVAGALVKHRADCLGFEAVIPFVAVPRVGDGQRVGRTFVIRVLNLTTGAAEQTAEQTLTQDRRVGRSTGYADQTGTGAAASSIEDATSRDLGLQGDDQLVTLHRLAFDYETTPTAGDLIQIRITCTEGHAVIPGVLLREKFA
jgi:hypothetical protein